MGPFTGRPRDTLTTYGNAITAITFQCVNEAVAVMERAKTARDDHLVIKAIATTVAAAKDLLELGIGKTTKLNVNVRNQEDLPDYGAWLNQLPPHMRAAADELLDQVMSRRVLPVTATVVPAETIE